MNIPSLPLAELADAAIDFLVETCAPFTREPKLFPHCSISLNTDCWPARLGCSFLFYAASHGC